MENDGDEEESKVKNRMRRELKLDRIEEKTLLSVAPRMLINQEEPKSRTEE